MFQYLLIDYCCELCQMSDWWNPSNIVPGHRTHSICIRKFHPFPTDIEMLG